MDITRLHEILKSRNTDRTDLLELENVVDRYPYFQMGIFAYLDCLYRYDNGRFRDELSRLSIFVNDRKALFYYLLRDDYSFFFKKTGKQELPKDRTDILLNAFFESADVNTVTDSFEYDIPSSAGLATTDYLAYLTAVDNGTDLQENNDTPRFKHQEIIDTYIEKSEKEGYERIKVDISDDQGADLPLVPDDDEEELTDEAFFTETLAKIYVKQQKYEKAYKIIKHLSLNYPKKNIYFADQLSFLEKLIINSKYKNRK